MDPVRKIQIAYEQPQEKRASRRRLVAAGLSLVMAVGIAVGYVGTGFGKGGAQESRDSRDARESRARDSGAKIARSERMDTPEAFTEHVLDIAVESFPELKAQQSDTPLVLRIKDEGHLSLENLYKVVKANFGPREADTEIKRYLKSIATLAPEAHNVPADWSEVRKRLRPQIFPVEYTRGEAGSARLVFRPLAFSKALLEGFVIDSEDTFQYVTADHLKKWGVERKQVVDAAYENLKSQCDSLKLDCSRANGRGAKGKYLTIAITDGYAAARILLPQVRSRIEQELGHPCFIAIPNRDFLIAWSYDFSNDEKFRNQVRRDFHYRDHPLSPRVYRLNNLQLAPDSDRSDRSEKSDNNDRADRNDKSEPTQPEPEAD